MPPPTPADAAQFLRDLLKLHQDEHCSEGIEWIYDLVPRVVDDQVASASLVSTDRFGAQVTFHLVIVMLPRPQAPAAGGGGTAKVARAALGQLLALDTSEYLTLHAGVAGGSVGARAQALQVLALYWAGQEAAAGPVEPHADIVTAVTALRDSLAELPYPGSVEAVWDLLMEDATELVDLLAHQARGTTPGYATDKGDPLDEQARRVAMLNELHWRRDAATRAALLLAGGQPSQLDATVG